MKEMDEESGVSVRAVNEHHRRVTKYSMGWIQRLMRCALCVTGVQAIVQMKASFISISKVKLYPQLLLLVAQGVCSSPR